MVTVRLSGVLIVVGLAIGVTPTVVGVARSKVLSMAAATVGLGGVLGLATNVAARLRQPQRPEGGASS